ncbi:hypothetical protein PVAND_000242 [Polypedilum vanderplanki]|uniref:Heat shock protein 70 n=1 Tax=Polypedilum vanderplanki TaxID=319348 RepID=A0A9J6BJ86_POLVA|nr:hypothetical protein PVAND_000242 [Polypedilum vanderplanki]
MKKHQQRIAARNQLEGYIFSCKQAVEDAPADRLSESDKNTVRDKCNAELKWLDSNSLAEKEEFEDHMKETQRVCGPIMAKIHSGAAGAGPKAQGYGQQLMHLVPPLKKLIKLIAIKYYKIL